MSGWVGVWVWMYTRMCESACVCLFFARTTTDEEVGVFVLGVSVDARICLSLSVFV